MQALLVQPLQPHELPLQIEMSINGLTSVAKNMREQTEATGRKPKEVELREAAQVR